MKKILYLFLASVIGSIYSCHNKELREFEDFDYTTTYFPYQYPVRTLVLGDYMFDNKNDTLLKFVISARMGGVYNNTVDRNVKFQVDPTLVTKLATTPNSWDGKSTPSADTLAILPSQYYTLSSSDQFQIPSGSFTGGVTVQLTDAFLDDPKAVKTKYVLPLRIISSTTDSVLRGKTTLTNPDPRIASSWVFVPKDYTIFGIKYVNRYHGKYLHRGVSAVTDTVSSTLLETVTYRTKYVENNEIWALQTIGRNKVTISATVKRVNTTSPGTMKMDLTFDSYKNCVISTAAGSAIKVSGTGKFVKDGDSWGEQARNAIYLKYNIVEGPRKHAVTDTLVFRDKAVVEQEYSPVILP